jgi:hypothetical protein
MEMISNIRTWAGTGLMMLSAVTMFTACDDDDNSVKFQPEAPVVSVGEVTFNSLSFTWTSVEGAFEYEYTLRDENGVYIAGALTQDTSASFENLDAATPYTLSVIAYAQDALNTIGSEAGTLTATTADAPVDNRLWEVTGIYYSAEWNKSWSAKLIAYPGDAYVIESWMGVEGYDFAFTVTSSGELSCDYSLDAYQYYCVPTGLTDYPTAYVYTAWGCSSFTGDAKEGSLFLYNYFYTGGYDTFTWGKTVEDNSGDNSTDDTTGGSDNSASSLASILGSYTEHTTGYWNSDLDYTDDVVIELADEAAKTVNVKGFAGSTEILVATVDLEAQTLTFAAQQAFASYYLFSAESDLNTPVVGTIAADGTITLNSWGAWYPWSGVYYTYATGMATTLTKK